MRWNWSSSATDARRLRSWGVWPPMTALRVLVKEGLFTDGDPPALLGSRCVTCGAHHFPRHETCPYCSAEDTRPVELSRTGTLWAWTAVTAPPPGYAGEIALRRRRGRIARRHPGDHPPDRERPRRTDPGLPHGTAGRAAAHRRGRQRCDHVRLRPRRRRRDERRHHRRRPAPLRSLRRRLDHRHGGGGRARRAARRPKWAGAGSRPPSAGRPTAGWPRGTRC